VLNELSVFLDKSISHAFAGVEAVVCMGITTITFFAGLPVWNVNLKYAVYPALNNVSVVEADSATEDTN
jgi:hypothetical protein